MYKIYEQTTHCKPLVIAVMKNGRIKGVLLSVIQWNGNIITKLFTTRSVIIGGPLAVNNDENILNQLFDAYRKCLPPYVVYSEIRPIYSMNRIEESLVDNRFQRVGHYNIMLDIRPNKQRLYDNLHKERQRNIRQAEKAGLRFTEVTEEKDISDITRLIHQTYRRKRVPISNIDMFSKEAVLMKEDVKFFAAYNKDNVMIAGQVRLCYKGLVYAWYAGSDDRYSKLRPNDFLMWNVICWAHDHGYKLFDFGGGGEPGKPYGVRDYKLKYGGEIFDYGRYQYLHRPLTYYLGKQVMNRIKKD